MLLKRNLIFIYVLFVFQFILSNVSYSQITGEEEIFTADSVIVFESPRPLIDTLASSGKYNSAYGAHIIFNTAGFGLGGFYEYKLNENYTMSVDFMMSGARNTDEIEVFDRFTGLVYVPYKLNRVYSFPLTLGIRRYLFQNELVDNFKPFIDGGAGITFILYNPYSFYTNVAWNLPPENQEFIDFFSALKYTNTYIRPAGYVGIGADFGFSKKNLSRLNIRYYYAPFLGGNQKDEFGFEIKDFEGNPIPVGVYSMHPFLAPPITNFGGLFITLSVGTKF